MLVTDELSRMTNQQSERHSVTPEHPFRDQLDENQNKVECVSAMGASDDDADYNPSQGQSRSFRLERLA